VTVKLSLVGNPVSARLPVSRLVGLSNILGGLIFFVSLAGIMVTHPMTKTFHSALHLALSVSGFLLFIGIGFYAVSNLKHLGIVSLFGIVFTLLGALLYSIGGFNYAILHGWLNLVTINDPLHQVPLNVAPNLLSLGTLITGAGALRNKTITRPTAIFLMIAALIFFVGWQQIGFSMIRFTNKSRYLKALLVTMPIGIAWCCTGFEQLLRKSNNLGSR
jgi:hypothetical protein